ASAPGDRPRRPAHRVRPAEPFRPGISGAPRTPRRRARSRVARPIRERRTVRSWGRTLARYEEGMTTQRMLASDVVEIYAGLEEAGVEIWLDGGWAIDAVLE